MSALRDHIKVRAERAGYLSRILGLLNVAINFPDERELTIMLIEKADEAASVLEDKLQDVHLPKDAA